MRSRGWSSPGTCSRATGAELPRRADRCPARSQAGLRTLGKGGEPRGHDSDSQRPWDRQRGSCQGHPGPRLSGMDWLEVVFLLPSPLPTPDQNAWEQVSEKGKVRRGCDLGLRTPIFSPVPCLCSSFTAVPYFLHPRGRGLLKAGPWEGLGSHCEAPCSVPVGPGAQQKTTRLGSVCSFHTPDPTR